MSTEVRWRRGTTGEHASFTGANGEVTVDTTKKTLVVHDGVTPGGWPIGTSGGATNTVNSIAALRLLNKTTTQTANVIGYNSPGDGGGGRYNLDAADTTSTDNGGSIIVAADAGRWKLQHNGTVDLEQFGAFAAPGSDAGAAMTRAFSDTNIKEIHLSAKTYYLSTPVTFPRGGILTGVTGMSSTLNIFTSSDAFILTNLTSVRELNINCVSQTGGAVFKLNTAAGSMEKVTLSNLDIYNPITVANDSKHATNIATNIRISNVHSVLTRGVGYDFENVYAFLEMRDCMVGFLFVTTATNAPGFRLRNNEGSYFVNCEMTGSFGVVAGTAGGQEGFNIANSKAVYLQRCFSDVAGGIGFNISNVQYLRMAQCTAALGNGTAYSLSSVNQANLVDIYAGGRQGMSGAAAGSHGILLNSCNNTVISSGEAHSFTGNGVFHNTPGLNNVVTGVNIHNNNSYGYATSGGTGVLASSLNLRANTTDYLLGNTNDQLRTCFVSGVYTDRSGA